MSAFVLIVGCMSERLIADKPVWNTDRVPCATDDPLVMPLEHLEARICELAGHLTAATCRFLLLVADFDARGGWASWEMPSCAAWLAWKCQIAPGTAREHVRVARALGQFPVIRAEFAAARLSYAKVRELTRIATPETEKDLAETVMPMTAGQAQRFIRAHRQVTRGEQDGRPAVREKKLSWRYDETGISISAGLPPADGAVVLQALRAWLGDLEHPHDGHKDGVPAGDLAAALTGICEQYLSSRAATADNPDSYQVIIHVGSGAITGAPEPGGDVPQGTSAAKKELPVTHPAYPWRCHVEDGQAIDTATLQMIACDATISTMLHGQDGTVLNAGRRTRKPSAALRRAVRERDRHRCRFPGCESRRTDLHHIRFWANGGQTKLANLISLCRRHHALIHDTGIAIAAAGAGFTFYLPDGTPIPGCPPLPAATAEGITGCHDAAVTYHTIVPPHSGDRLDLHEAIWICFHNAEVQARRREQALTTAA
jgi:hypothetical protein